MTHSIIDDARVILAGHTNEESSLLAMLEEVQSRHRYLPRDVLILISERLTSH